MKHLAKKKKMHDIFLIILRTFLGFFLLIISMKLMGKREIGQLSIFDFTIVLSIADIMIIGIENYQENVWFFIVPMAIIVMLQKVIAYLCLKSPWFREKIDGKERIIISKGKVLESEMKKERYNMSDLYSQLREKNIREIGEVEYAILETNGHLSVFTFEENTDKIFPLPLIISGKVQNENLKLIDKTEKWLNKELSKMGIEDYKEIYGVSYINGKLKIVQNSTAKL